VTPEELGVRLKARGFVLEPFQLEQLARFHALLLDRNRVLNLTRIWNLEDMVVKHYVDCLMVLRYLPALPSPLLDVGTGPGFPGIPLKIVSPETHIILGEGVRKRVDFLRDVRDALNLQGLDIVGRNIDWEFQYPVGGVITRAVEDICDTLKRVRFSVVTGGIVVFMKGPNVDDEKVMAAKKQAKNYEEIADHAYVLPGSDNRRRLVIYRKRCPEEPK
jgi:16S rRNA (guanine527-N7)-methyltransferase